MNAELFEKINEVLTEHPELHDQESWENTCRTTRCVAGWAIHLTTGEPLYAATEIHHPSVLELAEQLGLPRHSGFSRIAAKLLGLGEHGRVALFHYCDDLEAREAVARAAAGDEDGFRAIVGRAWERAEGER